MLRVNQTVVCRLLRAVAGLFLGVLLLGLTGCSGTAGRDLREERDPMIQRALVKKRARDIDGAVKLFYQSLEKNPRYARPDLELGLLFDDFKEDYIRAIFHYERYLAKRPEAEKRQIVEELVRTARLSYAASLPHQPSGAIAEIKSLKQENRMLRRQILELQNSVRRLKGEEEVAPPPAGGVAQGGVPEPDPAPAPDRSYIVQRGDTLMKIARKVYGDPTKWERIYEANRATMASPQSLNVGQSLIVPGEQGP